MKSTIRKSTTVLVLGAGIMTAAQVFAHGNVAPQPVNTDALPDVGEEWLTENPYRNAGDEVWQKAVEIGSSGFNQNCARCHGLGAVSGGLAPDLRYLEANEFGDEWFLERFRHGYTQNGITKMPVFADLLGQKAGWAIKLYVETRPEDGALDPFESQLKSIRDDLMAKAEAVEGGKATPEDYAGEIPAIVETLSTIAGQVHTASGAKRADSIALEASLALDGSAHSFRSVAEILTIGLSAAQ